MDVGRVVYTLLHSLKFPTDSIQMWPVTLMLRFKHIPTFREHGDVLKSAVLAPKSQLIHNGKHHFKMVRSAGCKGVKRKVY